MKIEKVVKFSAIFYLILGLLYFTFKRDLYGGLNFSAGFFLVIINFAYLEKLTVSLTEKNVSNAKYIILINLVRYPLIAVAIYAIIHWKNFRAIPFIFGLSAIIVGLTLSPIAGGKRENGS